MRCIRILALVGMLLLAAILMLALPASAESSKTPFDVYEVSCDVTPGIQWVAGHTLHVRGQESQNIFYDPETFEILGENSIVSNVNSDLNTGQANLFGTFSAIYLPESNTGTFDGTWNGELSPASGFVGRALGHGTDDITGKKIKVTVRGVDLSEVPPELWIILSEPPWTECEVFGGIFRDTGFIHNRGAN